MKSLEAALWSFHDADDFREAVLKAVNLGDDADTTGAVSGELAGASWGELGVPSEWLERPAEREMIEHSLAGIAGEEAGSPSYTDTCFAQPMPARQLPGTMVVDAQFLAGA